MLMSSDIVWNAFYLHALLLYKQGHKDKLVIPHHGQHSDRLTEALAERNLAMVGTGQPQWAHSCDVCERLITTFSLTK